MLEAFPAVGHRYLVDFKAFRVELDFACETLMTDYNLDANGNRAGQETVTISVEPIRDGLFLVTWTESDRTTVVHLEDHREIRIITNISDPASGLSKFEGSVAQID